MTTLPQSRTELLDATAPEWKDWVWQMQNRLSTLEDLEQHFALSPDENDALTQMAGRLPVAITPFYASLIDPGNPDDPIRRTMIPRTAELIEGPGEMTDPLGEEAHSPIPGIVHTYRDKVLFLVTDHCATYCRYCTRARMVGSGELPPSRRQWETALAYIREHTEIRDVLLSGGDPLTLSDQRLEWLLEQLSTIPHVELVRIGTKVPIVMPQRITPELCRILSAHHPLWFSVHILHEQELHTDVEAALTRLADAGVPLMSQTVLLKGINDSLDTLEALFRHLLTLRVKPYYLHQCDAITGSAQFRTPVQTGIDILKGLHGRITGYGIPHVYDRRTRRWRKGSGRARIYYRSRWRRTDS